MNRTLLSLLLLLLAGILIFSCNLSKNQKDDLTAVKVESQTAGVELTDDYPYGDGTVFATFDGQTVTIEEFNRFLLRTKGKALSGGGGHYDGGDQNWQDLVVYTRYYSGVKEAEKRNLQSDPHFKSAFAIAYRLALAAPFKKWLEKNAEIPSEAIAALIPEEWVQINFLLRVYPDRDTALDAMNVFSGGGEFYSSDMKKAGVKVYETGPLFPGSGFFEDWDEYDLFRLDERELSGPIRSGIGWALVGLKEKKVYSEEEKNRFLAKKREELAAKHLAEEVAEFIGDFRVEYDDEALAGAVSREFNGMGFSYDPVVAFYGKDSKTEISYRLFRLLNPVNYANLNLHEQRAQWQIQVKQDIKGIERQYLVGQMAHEYQEEGSWAVPFTSLTRKLLYDYRKVLLYAALNRKIADQVKSDISKKDLEEYYKSNNQRFYLPAKAEIVYLFTIDTALSQKWKTAVDEGKSFRAVAESLPMSRSPHSDPRDSEFKRTIVSQGDQKYMSIQDGLFSLRQDEIGVIEGDMGHYLINILSRNDRRTPPLEEVSDQVLDFLAQERTAIYLSDLIDDLVKEVDVQLVESYKTKFQPPADLNTTPEVPMKDIPFPDRG